MYTDVRQWKRIRARVLVQGESINAVAASEHMSRVTVAVVSDECDQQLSTQEGADWP